MDNIHKRLFEARKARRRSRAWLAERLGVHASTIARWERPGGEFPPLLTAFALADELDISLRWLIKGEPPYMEKPLLAWRDEAALLELYRRLNPSGRKALQETLRDSVGLLTKASAREP